MEHIQEVSWDKIKQEIQKTNYELFLALKQIPNGVLSRYKFFVAKYRYGQLLIENGKFLPPLACTCPTCTQFNKQIENNHIPLTLVLNNSVEVYLDYPEQERIAPLRLISKGELFGVFETLDFLCTPTTKPIYPFSPWNVSAGVRSVVVLSPVGNAKLANNIVRFLKKNDSTDEHLDKAVSNKISKFNAELISLLAPYADAAWNVKVLIFPQELLIEGIENHALLHQIFKIGWKQSYYLREKSALEISQKDSYKRNVLNGRHKPDPYLDIMVKHIVEIAEGNIPGFRPFSSAEAGPFEKVQQLIFENRLMDLNTKEEPKIRFPFILQAAYICDEINYAYYSITKPSQPGLLRLLNRGHKAALEDLKYRLRSLDKATTPLNLQDTHFFSADCNAGFTKQFKNFEDLAELDFKAQFKFLESKVLHKKPIIHFFSTKGFFNAFIRIVRK